MPEQFSDAILLERFVSRREEAAFVALVQRHRTARAGNLPAQSSAMNTTSKTFFRRRFSLARKAAGIPWHDSVGGWLGLRGSSAGAGRAVGPTCAQQRRETSFTTLVQNGSAAVHGRNRFWLPETFHPLTSPSAELERRELRRVLDDELLRLPEKYRAPVVLCYLEGRTHEEAARQLGYPAGSISRRLDGLALCCDGD